MVELDATNNVVRMSEARASVVDEHAREIERHKFIHENNAREFEQIANRFLNVDSKITQMEGIIERTFLDIETKVTAKVSELDSFDEKARVAIEQTLKDTKLG